MVKVVIPIYKTDLNKYELKSLAQCFSVLKRYPIVFIKPETLDISPLTTIFGSGFTTESFPDKYFKDIKSYNILMLSSEFYERFLDVKYILIYQTDVFVFRDELEEWCSKDYDYIGAPWIPKKKYLKWYYKIVLAVRVLLSRFSETNRLPFKRFYKVGNGGFSLRKTKSFYTLSQELTSLITVYKEHSGENENFNEDVFWGVEVNKECKRLNIPSYKEALRFSMEMYPDAGFQLNHSQLPFGTHAWYKKPYDAFWKQFIDFE